MEDSRQYLDRVIADSPNSAARAAASRNKAIIDGHALSCKGRGVKTRRSYWDALAGVSMKKYGFAVLTEACGYRGKVAPPTAVSTGLPPLKHRVPQKGKWGNDILKT